MKTAFQPIGHYTSAPQGTALVERFGDYNLEKLPEVDQAALLAILSMFLYLDITGQPKDLFTAAEAAIPEDLDKTTDAAFEALEILNGIHRDEVLNLILFIAQ